jgi:small subunit ribosomal protein S6
VRPYEVMVIFDAGVEPPAIQGVLDNALEIIRTTGGVPGTVDRWGKRPFAYEVKHRREGYYVVVELTAETATVTELDRVLSLADEVLRHKVIRLPDHIAGRTRRPTDGRGSGGDGRGSGGDGRGSGGDGRGAESGRPPARARGGSGFRDADGRSRSGARPSDTAAG